MKLRLGFLLIALLPFSAVTEENLSVRDEAKATIATLASPAYWGRGYTKDGMGLAADYLEQRLKEFGVRPLDGKSYRQDFELPVNTFPSDMEVVLNGRTLSPGLDYIIAPHSRGIEAEAELVPTTEPSTYANGANDIVVTRKSKLTWSVSRKVSEKTEIFVDENRVPEIPNHVQVKVRNEFVEKFKTTNICGIIPGTETPDAYLVLTAHYDHLGGMGRDVYFPGANDNASGTALLLALAKHYIENPPPYSVVFLFFAAEEAGLVGSKYFVEHPLIDLKKIRFLTNFDLNGTGENGITVVNATEFPKPFALLQEANARENYFVQVKARGKAPNSDHYWFSENGVPAFFIYTLGGTPAYHDVFDQAATLPLTKFEDLYRLVLEFNDTVMKTGS